MSKQRDWQMGPDDKARMATLKNARQDWFCEDSWTNKAIRYEETRLRRHDQDSA